MDKVFIFKLHNDYNTPDGTGVSDYIHIVDLARGHVCSLRAIEEGCGLEVYNLGTGKGHSVLDIKFVKKNSCMTRELKLAGSEELVDAVFFVKLISEYSILGGRQYFVVFSKR